MVTIHDMKIDSKALLDTLRKEIYIDEEVELCGRFSMGLEVAVKIVEEMQVDTYMRYLDEHR